MNELILNAEGLVGRTGVIVVRANVVKMPCFMAGASDLKPGPEPPKTHAEIAPNGAFSGHP